MSRFLLAAVLALMPVAASAATLTIKIENVSPKGGTMRVSLYDAPAWTKDPDTPLASANVPAVSPETVVTLADVRPGVYGVKAFQDVNNNGKFDQGFLGLPLERYGFSRDAKPFLSQPGFDSAKITVSDGANEITIRLQ